MINVTKWCFAAWVAVFAAAGGIRWLGNVARARHVVRVSASRIAAGIARARRVVTVSASNAPLAAIGALAAVAEAGERCIQ